MAAIYLNVSGLFDAKADATVFHPLTFFTEIEEGYETNMVKMDYDFMDQIQKMCDEMIKKKFPVRRTLMACKQNSVR